MPTSPYTKPQPGQRFTPNARLQGELIDLLQRDRMGKPRAELGKGPVDRDHGRIMVLNDTGAALERFAVVSVSTSTIDPNASAARLLAYKNTPYHTVVDPDGSILDPICILLEPIPDGGVGMALGMGVTQCLVDFPVADQVYQYARSVDGETGYLQAADQGNVELLSPREIGTEGTQWCLVRLLGGWFYSDDEIQNQIEEQVYTALECGCLDSCLHPEALIPISGVTDWTTGAYRYGFTFSSTATPHWSFASGTHIMYWDVGNSYWETEDISGPCEGGTPPGTYRWRMTATGLDAGDVTVSLVLTAGTCPDFVDISFTNRFEFTVGCGNLMVLQDRQAAAQEDRMASCSFCLYPIIETETIQCLCDLDDVEASVLYGLQCWNGSAWVYELSGEHSSNPSYDDCCTSIADDFPNGIIEITDLNNDCIYGSGDYTADTCADSSNYTWDIDVYFVCDDAPDTYQMEILVEITKDATTESWYYQSEAMTEAELRAALLTSITCDILTSPGTPTLCNLQNNIQVFAW